MRTAIIGSLAFAVLISLLVTAADAGKWSHQGFRAYAKRQQLLRQQERLPPTSRGDRRN